MLDWRSFGIPAGYEKSYQIRNKPNHPPTKQAVSLVVG